MGCRPISEGGARSAVASKDRDSNSEGHVSIFASAGTSWLLLQAAGADKPASKPAAGAGGRRTTQGSSSRRLKICRRGEKEVGVSEVAECRSMRASGRLYTVGWGCLA